jgi:hypothetical protein
MSTSYRTPDYAFRRATGITLVLALGILAALGSIASPGRAGEPAAPRYHVTDVGLIAGSFFTPSDINESGVIVGEAGRRGAIWTPNTPNGLTGTGVKIGVFSGQSLSFFTAINDDGVAVGGTEPNSQVGFFHINGVSTPLHSPPNDYGGAFDINTSGRIVGVSSGPGRTSEAHYWAW